MAQFNATRAVWRLAELPEPSDPMSRSTDAHNVTAVCINLNDHRLVEPWRLTRQSPAKRDSPHRPFPELRELCLDAFRRKRHLLLRDLDGLLARQLRIDLASRTRHGQKQQRSAENSHTAVSRTQVS